MLVAGAALVLLAGLGSASAQAADTTPPRVSAVSVSSQPNRTDWRFCDGYQGKEHMWVRLQLSEPATATMSVQALVGTPALSAGSVNVPLPAGRSSVVILPVEQPETGWATAISYLNGYGFGVLSVRATDAAGNTSILPVFSNLFGVGVEGSARGFGSPPCDWSVLTNPYTVAVRNLQRLLGRR